MAGLQGSRRTWGRWAWLWVGVVVAAMALGSAGAEPSGDDQSLTLGLTGDVMIGRMVDRLVERYGHAYPWGDLQAELAGTDVVLINLETTLTHSRRAVPKTFNFRADPEHVAALVRAGVDVANLANNHILDFGLPGMMATMASLEAAGIRHVGAGRDRRAACRPVTLTRDGLSLGIIGCTDNEPGWRSGPERPGTCYVDVDEPEPLLRRIRSLAGRVDRVVLSIHWGPNMRQRPPERFVRFAHRTVDAGVDVLHGHSAHVVQGVEAYEGSVILYDTGDFVDDYRVDPRLRNDLGFYYRVGLTPQGPQAVDLLPVAIQAGQVNRATGGDRDWILERMQGLSAELGTDLAVHGGRLRLELSGQGTP